MNVLLVQVDGKLPNIALMRIAAHHRALGNEVDLVRGVRSPGLFDPKPDLVYASVIFERNAALILKLQDLYPIDTLSNPIIVGGTGWANTVRLEDYGITTAVQDYTDYPKYRQSIGFTQRGCRLRCPFCVVPTKEGAVVEEQTVNELWRGDPWPRELVLLDNDFFGQPNWRDRIREIRDGRFKVNFNQGINARFLTEEAAEAIASVDYRDADMKVRRVYTAWDNRKDEDRLFAGLQRLVNAGVARSSIMVYMLIGYWPGETAEDRDYRRRQIREFGALPYPMPYTRTPELVGFQRWVLTHYDKSVSWLEFSKAGYRPRRV